MFPLLIGHMIQQNTIVQLMTLEFCIQQIGLEKVNRMLPLLIGHMRQQNMTAQLTILEFSIQQIGHAKINGMLPLLIGHMTQQNTTAHNSCNCITCLKGHAFVEIFEEFNKCTVRIVHNNGKAEMSLTALRCNSQHRRSNTVTI